VQYGQREIRQTEKKEKTKENKKNQTIKKKIKKGNL
jgi:hypothetical protein